jgi:DNA/RNA-binding domain of Phe-tRNA-synthetase-like protein
VIHQLGPVSLDHQLEGIDVSLVLAENVIVGPADPELAHEIDRNIASFVETDEDRRSKVRQILRHGKYKPTGRGKPASEYLGRAAREGQFPRINGLVDALNLVSLTSALPISLLDLEGAQSTTFRLRRGRAGESYVFNLAGQTIELEDLLLVAALPQDRPLANPVKDSMQSKIKDHTKNALAVIYAPAHDPELPKAKARLTELYQRLSALGRTGS